MKTREEVFNELIESIYEVSRSTSAYESIPRKYGTEDELYMVEAHTINLIGEKSKVSPSYLAKLTNKTKGAISQMVDKLLKKGLVIKYKNPTNNREVIIELSDKGKQAYKYHKELDQIEYGRMLSRLNQFSTEDLINFTKIASEINDHVKNLIQNK
ncbi:MarR family winged helix-turn-helix transcriptional regulator [Priestia megaterium]|uniref:MarR family winged helix-turn-helix transcriptional regulator n=1 Tax=Priestia TaxID=2800373 RepID=UPI00366DBF52